eukprot:6466440-Prymnesium_polylepis.1
MAKGKVLRAELIEGIDEQGAAGELADPRAVGRAEGVIQLRAIDEGVRDDGGHDDDLEHDAEERATVVFRLGEEGGDVVDVDAGARLGGLVDVHRLLHVRLHRQIVHDRVTFQADLVPSNLVWLLRQERLVLDAASGLLHVGLGHRLLLERDDWALGGASEAQLHGA